MKHDNNNYYINATWIHSLAKALLNITMERNIPNFNAMMIRTYRDRYVYVGGLLADLLYCFVHSCTIQFIKVNYACMGIWCS